MPLIIVTGYPCSGKSHRANQLLLDFQSRIVSQPSEPITRKTVTLVPSHHSSLDSTSLKNVSGSLLDQKTNPRDQIYNSSLLEKTARAEEFSAIRRALSKNNVVIADGLNYIKGFRYQLWCEAKAAGTRCVVVHAAAREDEVGTWNDERLKAWGWEVEEQSSSHEAQSKVGAKVGKDVMGDLMPESHTAVFGDKVMDYNAGSRSRTSSMGGGDSSDEDETPEDEDTKDRTRKAREDTMTLKSLYISDRVDNPTTHRNSTDISQGPQQPPSSTYTSVSPSTPPSPSSSLPYTPATLRALTMRYEPPSPFTRWDTPLFTIPSTDPHPPYNSIWEAIFPPPTKILSKKALSQLPRSLPSTDPNSQITTTTSSPQPQQQPNFQPTSAVRQHAATVLPKATGSEALQTLETGTAEVVKHLLAAARARGLDGAGAGNEGQGGRLTFDIPIIGPSTSVSSSVTNTNTDQEAITINDTTTTSGEKGKTTTTVVKVEIDVPLNTALTQPSLQRLRRKYTQIQRGGIAHGVGYVSGREEVIRGFVRFLEAEWEV